MVFNSIYGPKGVPKACIFDIYFSLAKAISIHQFSTAIELISTPVGGFACSTSAATSRQLAHSYAFDYAIPNASVE